jgi:large subunit ribosomal protein L17
MRDLILHGRITTSIAKAKAVQPAIEKLITKAKVGTDAKKRLMTAELMDRKLSELLIDDAKTRFSPRNSGYTRIIKLGKRKSDATEMVILEFVDEKVVTEQIAPVSAKPTKVEAVEKKASVKKPAVKKVEKKVKKA